MRDGGSFVEGVLLPRGNRLKPTEQNRNRPTGKSCAVMLEQKLSPVLKPLYRLFKVATFEDLLKRLLKLVFTVVLLIPLVLLPIYFFFFTLLHL